MARYSRGEGWGFRLCIALTSVRDSVLLQIDFSKWGGEV